MTSDTPDQPVASAEETPRRSTRRRVTRATSAPTTSAPAPIVVPATTAASTPAASEPTTTAAPQPASSTTAAPSSTPARRSRRASRRAGGPAPVEAAPTPEAAPAPEEQAATDEPAAADDATPPAEPITLPTKAEEAPTSATPSLSLDDIVLPGRDAASGEQATSEAPAPGEARDESAGAEKPAATKKSGAKKSGATKAGAKKAAATEDEKKPSGRKAAPKKTAAATSKTAAPESATSEKSPSAERPAGPTTTGTAGGSATPRLATTALLFQAPELSGQRAARRAQAPAGPPRPSEEETPATSARQQRRSAAADESAASEKPATAEKSSTKKAGKSSTSRRAEDATAKDATETTETAAQDAASATSAAQPVEAPTSAPLELSDVDEAAVDELELIETEIVDEGVELVGFGPADFLDDGDESDIRPRRRRRRGGRGRRGGRKGDRRPEDDTEGDGSESSAAEDEQDRDADQDGARREEQGAETSGESATEAERSEGTDESEQTSGSSRRRRRRRRGRGGEREAGRSGKAEDEVTALKGSTRLEAKRQRRREGRDAGRRRQVITEAEFLARRESVERSMIVREHDGRTQIAVLEDGVLVEHYVSQQAQASMVGNVYLGRVQNVLPSMEAAFVDVGKGRNAVLYAGEVNWDAAGIEGQPRRIEEALKSGDSVLVQVTKDPIGHKGARLTSQVTLAGRYLVFVPGGGMTGISRKLPDTERNRLKKILRDVVPDGAGVIVRTAAEGASEEELRADVERLQSQWRAITAKAEKSSTNAPALLQGEADMAIRVVRDIFNDDFASLVVQGEDAWTEISSYVAELAPDLRERVTRWTGSGDVFAQHRVDEQLAKGMDRKVWLPSGGSLVIDRTEAMTVIDVNTGKFTGSGGTLEETVTRNNLEAAEEIVRQLRLRDIGGIIVIDFVDMVLESNRDLVLRRLVECLGRDRTKHQVAEVTSLGLVQMTRKRVGQGLVEAFSSTCEHCKGRGFIVHEHPVEKSAASSGDGDGGGAKRSRRKRSGAKKEEAPAHADVPKLPDDESEKRQAVKATLATIAAAAAHAHEHEDEEGHEAAPTSGGTTATDDVAGAPAVEQGAGTPAETAPDPDAAGDPSPATGAEETSEDNPAGGDAPPKGAGAAEAPEQAATPAASLTDTP
ncbi:Rne/Rng family ribonuclease [Isoptericola sp. b408]|uniref:Rne/Rng family ribonuclease n=1 Tax=Isoptericola sp. b408 TaxID=3064653 RepID=UPI002713642D|nr:Rne/Rng family ribonuclease [Isoptericola sp. b408]MDO8150996.1 Rne/Rng family ribonuclease [Isoptericola sp. b408]